MKTLKATLLLLTLSLPIWAANKPDKPGKHDHDPPVTVPEGGGVTSYLLASGAAMAGVLLVRRRWFADV